MNPEAGKVEQDGSSVGVTQKNDRRVTIMQLLRPHRKALWFGLLAITGESVADLLTPWPLKIVLDNVLGKKQSDHGWLNGFIHQTVGYAPYDILIFACVAVLAVSALDALCTYFDKYITTTVGQWVTHDLRSRMYEQVQRLSLTYHDHNQTGDLISRVTTDIDSVQSFIVSGMLTMLVDVVTVIGMIGVMFYLNWQLTLVAMAVVPVLFAIVYTYTRKVKKASRNVRKHESKLLSVVQEVLGSVRVVKAFAREEYEIHRLEGESLETVEAALEARKLKAKLVPLVTIVTGLGTCGVLFFGGRAAMRAGLTGGSIYLFITYIRNMYKPMQDISKGMDSYSKADVGYERIQEVLNNDNEMRDMPGAGPMPPIKGEVDIEHVDFWYNENEPVLRDVNVHVDAGTMVALVGPTGSGKTTLANLVARFYDPTKGVVKIDGIDVKSVQQETLREQIGFVLQDTVLFSGTIWDNIAYGRPNATHSEIVEAAKDANALEFIDRLPEKFNAIVGERGLSLSGGQRQRIAIARAIVRNSPILILDEPSSGLDAASEELVFEALDRLMKNKTAIVIAHRLSTIRNANCIYVVKQGTVVESGTHHDLLQREHGEYRALYDIQFNTEEAAATIG